MHLLDETIKVLHKHEWKIINLDDKVKIPTSDDPVICLNYYSNNNYDFGGGWNNIEESFPQIMKNGLLKLEKDM